MFGGGALFPFATLSLARDAKINDVTHKAISLLLAEGVDRHDLRSGWRLGGLVRPFVSSR
jgi:hypothetical protein